MSDVTKGAHVGRRVETQRIRVKRAMICMGTMAVAVVLCFLGLMAIEAHAGGIDRANMTNDGAHSYVAHLWNALKENTFDDDSESNIGAMATSMDSALAEMGFIVSTPSDPATDIPSWVSKEAIDLSHCGRWIANSDWTLLALFSESGAALMPGTVMEELQSKGWFMPDQWGSLTKSGSSAVTLVKEKGECRWMMVSFAEIGDETSVVLRIQHE